MSELSNEEAEKRKRRPDRYGILDLAMMLETQALDLYLRFAEKSSDERTQKVLFSIADEEKAHLGSLGALMNKKI